MKITSAGLTHKGLVRGLNEDAFLIDREAGVYLVADGMGGHLAGEVASAMAAEAILGFIESEGPASALENSAEIMAAALKKANSEIYEAAQANSDYNEMGTTLVALWVRGEDCFCGHVGDSRAYLFRQGALKRVTRDHTIVATLVDRGAISEEDARTHPLRNRLAKSVGVLAQVEGDVNQFQVEAMDRILLCSDGLTDLVEERAIELALRDNPDPNEACQVLLDQALAAGGTDNVTVVILDAA